MRRITVPAELKFLLVLVVVALAATSWYMLETPGWMVVQSALSLEQAIRDVSPESSAGKLAMASADVDSGAIVQATAVWSVLLQAAVHKVCLDL